MVVQFTKRNVITAPKSDLSACASIWSAGGLVGDASVPARVDVGVGGTGSGADLAPGLGVALGPWAGAASNNPGYASAEQQQQYYYQPNWGDETYEDKRQQQYIHEQQYSYEQTTYYYPGQQIDPSVYTDPFAYNNDEELDYDYSYTMSHFSGGDAAITRKLETALIHSQLNSNQVSVIGEGGLF